MLPVEKARESVEALVEQARTAGADAADALYVCSESQSVQVRLGELEHVDRSEGEEMGLRVFVGQRSASVASSDFSPEALRELVARAVAMAREAPEDPYAGLAPADLLSSGPFPAIDSDDSSADDPQSLRERALAAEKAALAIPGVTNSSEGCFSARRSCLASATEIPSRAARSSICF